MQAEIHPQYAAVAVKCSCGVTFEIKSTMDKNTLNIEVCDRCHPFITGNQKMAGTAGRVDSFNKKFNFGGKEN